MVPIETDMRDARKRITAAKPRKSKKNTDEPANDAEEEEDDVNDDPSGEESS